MQGRLKKLVAGLLFAVMVASSILPETVYAVEEGYTEDQTDSQIINGGEDEQNGAEETDQTQTDQEQGNGSDSGNNDDINNTGETDGIGSDDQAETLPSEETDNSLNTPESETKN